MKTNISSYKMDFQTYASSVTMYYSPTLPVAKIYEEIAKKYGIPGGNSINESGDGALTITLPSIRKIFIILDKDSDVATLHHECIHAASSLFSMIQTSHIDATEEVFAYLSETIFASSYRTLIGKMGANKKSFLLLNK